MNIRPVIAYRLARLYMRKGLTFTNALANAWRNSNQQAPYVRMKDFDHEDVEVEFSASKTLNIIANVLASIGVFCALMLAIAVVAQVPDAWLSWLVLAAGGV